jgi:SAM-dependent methyltransferase
VRSGEPGTMVDTGRVTMSLDGFATTLALGTGLSPDLTTDEYAGEQLLVNASKTLDFVVPIVERCGARSVVDIGCGVGAMVATFLERGFDAYGVDVAGLSQRWARLGLPPERFVIVDPMGMRLPFDDGSVDFAFSLGVIEHVGTSNGHSDRLPDYRARRAAWLREVFRILRTGGHMLMGGPNRKFPIDVAHGPDSRAAGWERALSRLAGASVHRTWGENFLWSYEDFSEYLEGLRYELEPLSVADYVHYGRVPSWLRPMVRAYVDRMPRSLLGTGLNPWVMALVRKAA